MPSEGGPLANPSTNKIVLQGGLSGDCHADTGLIPDAGKAATGLIVQMTESIPLRRIVKRVDPIQLGRK